MLEIFAFIVLIWLLPVISILIVLRLFINFWRRLGIKTHIIWVLIWLSLIAIIYFNRNIFLQTTSLPFVSRVIGLPLLAIGIFFYVWSVKTLKFKVLIAIPEVLNKSMKLVIKGPYSLCRHPLYFAALLIIFGIFLITGVISLFYLFIVWLVLIYPLTYFEEKELRERFGKEYEKYAKKVPRIFPKLS